MGSRDLLHETNLPLPGTELMFFFLYYLGRPLRKIINGFLVIFEAIFDTETGQLPTLIFS